MCVGPSIAKSTRQVGFRPAPRNNKWWIMSARNARPRLEALEDRTTPAVTAPTNELLVAAAQQIALPQNIASLAPAVTVASVAPSAGQPIAGPTVALNGGPFLPEIDALGFTGRL